MNGKALGIGLLCLVAGYLLLFGGASRERDRRRKITIEVATPHGPVRGSAVIEVTRHRAPWWFPTGTGNRNAVGVRGEAPHVALGDGRHLFLALNEPSHEKPIWEYFRPGAVLADGSFAPGRVPLLITFGDIGDPNTVRRVAPDGFEATFGAGYRLVALTVTDTREHATRGTLADAFPALYRELNRPAFDRNPVDIRHPTGPDLRNIGWDAFEMQDW